MLFLDTRVLLNIWFSKAETVKVVATGGLNKVLKPITDVFTVVDKDLTIRGLKIISDLVL